MTNGTNPEQIWYWNGLAWTNTGHTLYGANICGAGGYLFAYQLANPPDIYRYDGTGNGVPIDTPSFVVSAVDIVGDCEGNYYMLQVNGPSASLNKYDQNGNLVQSYPVLNSFSSPIAGAALSLVNGDLYFDVFTNNVVTFYRGTITGSSVTISPVGTLPTTNPLAQFGGASDAASCAFIPFGVPITTASLDTAYQCAGTPLTVSATGTAPFTWSVVSGAATLSSTTGSSIVITPTTSARVAVSGSSTSCGYVFTDTVTLIVPTALLDAGLPKSYLNCGTTSTTLTGSLTGTTPGLTYNLAWSPVSGILAGGTTLTPTVTRTATTLYTLTASTPASQGGCTFSDTTTLTVLPAAPPFSVEATRDSVFCTPASPFFTLYATPTPAASYYTYAWSGAPLSAGQPANIFNPKPLLSTGVRTYYLEVKDTFGCHTVRDTVRLTFHNLSATVTPPAASLCPGDTVTLRAQGSLASTATGQAPRWRYTWTPATSLSCATCSATIARPPASTLYGVTLTDSVSGCALYRSAELSLFSFLDSFSAGPDRVVRPDAGFGGSAPFSLAGRAPAGAQGLAWTPAEVLDNPFSAVTNGRVDTTTAFVLSASNGPCRSTDTAVVYVVGCAGVAMPTAFTPNGDRVNDVFTLANAGGAAEQQVAIRHLRIYNRWGTLVHEEEYAGTSGATTRPILRGWDGTLRGNGEVQPYGVYVWHLEGECTDQATGERTAFEQEGNVTLMR